MQLLPNIWQIVFKLTSIGLIFPKIKLGKVLRPIQGKDLLSSMYLDFLLTKSWVQLLRPHRMNTIALICVYPYIYIWSTYLENQTFLFDEITLLLVEFNFIFVWITKIGNGVDNAHAQSNPQVETNKIRVIILTVTQGSWTIGQGRTYIYDTQIR